MPCPRAGDSNQTGIAIRLAECWFMLACCSKSLLSHEVLVAAAGVSILRWGGRKGGAEAVSRSPTLPSSAGPVSGRNVERGVDIELELRREAATSLRCASSLDIELLGGRIIAGADSPQVACSRPFAIISTRCEARSMTCEARSIWCSGCSSSRTSSPS